MRKLYSLSRPTAWSMVGTISLFAGVFLAFFLEYWERITREQLH